MKCFLKGRQTRACNVQESRGLVGGGVRGAAAGHARDFRARGLPAHQAHQWLWGSCARAPERATLSLAPCAPRRINSGASPLSSMLMSESPHEISRLVLLSAARVLPLPPLPPLPSHLLPSCCAAAAAAVFVAAVQCHSGFGAPVMCAAAAAAAVAAMACRRRRCRPPRRLLSVAPGGRPARRPPRMPPLCCVNPSCAAAAPTLLPSCCLLLP